MNAILNAIIKGDLQTISELHSSGVDVFRTNGSGFTPLHLAASLGHNHLVLWYHRHGCKLDTMARDAVTPFISSIQFHHYATTALLIRLGYRIRITSRCNPPMSYAVCYDNWQALELIAMHHPEGLELPYEELGHNQGIHAIEHPPLWWALHGCRKSCVATLLALRVTMPDMETLPPGRAQLLGMEITMDEILGVRFRVYFSLSLLERLLNAC